MNTRVIVTRPAQDALPWVQALVAAGWQAESLPLIEIAGIDTAFGPCDAASKWRELHNYAACFFVSGNAVEYFFRQKPAPSSEIYDETAILKIASQPMPLSVHGDLTNLRWLAPGPGTARALRAAGVPEAHIQTPPAGAQQFDSQALWRQLGSQNWSGKRVLIVRGDSLDQPLSEVSPADGSSPSPGRDWIAQRWTQAGASVDFAVVYTRRAPLLTAAECDRARQGSRDGSVWLFSSSEAVGHLQNMTALADVDWREARAVATHPRIAARVRAAGWGVVAESRPTLPDIGRSIESLGHA